jgi:hypothetical protein
VRRRRLFGLAAILGLMTWPARLALAQNPPPPSTSASQPHDVTALAKATQNPVADLVSLPFQFNFNGGGALAEQTALNLNFQPVVPFNLNSRWNVVARTIVPINSVPTGAGTRQSGIGDIQEQLYVTPVETGPTILGVGPMLSFPTATAGPSETGSWAIGPGAVVVHTNGPYVLGGLLQQFWTFADRGDGREINQFVFQPFANYNFGRGWALAFAPIITADWNGNEAGEWTLPLGIGITRTTVFNGRPMNIGVQYYYNVVRPDGAPGFTLRFLLAPLYPHK